MLMNLHEPVVYMWIGYDGVEGFFSSLLELVQLKLSETIPTALCQGNEKAPVFDTVPRVLCLDDENVTVSNHNACKRCCDVQTNSFDATKLPQLKCHHFTSEYLKSTSCRHLRHHLSDGTNREKHVVVVDCVARWCDETAACISLLFISCVGM